MRADAARGERGRLYSYEVVASTLTNTTVDANAARGGGGGVCAGYFRLNIRGSKVCGNTAALRSITATATNEGGTAAGTHIIIFNAKRVYLPLIMKP